MKDLTVRDLKRVFGNEYPVINNLVSNRPDDYVFSSTSVVNTEDYFVEVLWGREDIINSMIEHNIEPLPERVEAVFKILKDSDLDTNINEGDEWMQDYTRRDIISAIQEVMGEESEKNIFANIKKEDQQ